MKYSEFFGYIEKTLIDNGFEYKKTEIADVLGFSRATFYNKQDSTEEVKEEVWNKKYGDSGRAR